VRKYDGVFVTVETTLAAHHPPASPGGGLIKKDGRDLQRLIRAIEGALSGGNKSVKVEMPKRLPDKVTGEMREHDIVLTITTGHHKTFVALECR
jgi:hypothetical protein